MTTQTWKVSLEIITDDDGLDIEDVLAKVSEIPYVVAVDESGVEQVEQ
jgi:hypothetical protein